MGGEEEEEEKCPHLWRRGRESAAASSWASSSSQQRMAEPSPTPLRFRSEVTEEPPGWPQPFSPSPAFQALPSSASSLLEAQAASPAPCQPPGQPREEGFPCP